MYAPYCPGLAEYSSEVVLFVDLLDFVCVFIFVHILSSDERILVFVPSGAVSSAFFSVLKESLCMALRFSLSASSRHVSR